MSAYLIRIFLPCTETCKRRALADDAGALSRMEVEDLDDDFFSIPKPAAQAGGGAFPKAGRRAGGSGGRDTENKPANAPAPTSDFSSGLKSGVGGNIDGAGGVGGYVPGAGRVGRRASNLGGGVQMNQEEAPSSGPVFGRDDREQSTSKLPANDAPPQNQLMGRRASPPVTQAHEQEQESSYAASRNAGGDGAAPKFGAGGYQPSLASQPSVVYKCPLTPIYVSSYSYRCAAPHTQQA